MCLSDPSACCDVLAGAPWVLAVLSAFFLLLLLSVAGICFVRLRVLPNPPEMCLPKALVSDDPPPTSTLCVAIAKPGLPAFARVQHLLSSNSCITKTGDGTQMSPLSSEPLSSKKKVLVEGIGQPWVTAEDGVSGSGALGVQHTLSQPLSWQGFSQLRLTMSLLLFLQALQNTKLSVAMQVPPLQLEEDPLALLLQTVLPSHEPSTAVQASATVPRLLRGLVQDVSGYCANGFGPNCTEGRDPSSTHSQLGHALGSQVLSQLEKDEEAGDGDDLPEQLMLMGLAGHSYIGDRDSQISKIWLPSHFQLYSKCQCPVLGADSHLPLPVPSRSCSQEHLQESLGTARHWIRLSSVRLLHSAETEGGQRLCAPQPLRGGGTDPEQGDSTVQRGGSPEQAELCLCSPCRLPPSPRSVLRAVPFSGYEPRAPAGSEP